MIFHVIVHTVFVNHIYSLCLSDNLQTIDFGALGIEELKASVIQLGDCVGEYDVINRLYSQNVDMHKWREGHCHDLLVSFS